MPPALLLAAAIAALALPAGPASAEPFRLAREFDLAPGDRFELRTEVGSVTVRGVDGRQASITVTSDREDLAQRVDIRFDHSGGRLGMVVERRDKGWFRHSGAAVRITIDLPRATPADLRASGGRIDVASLEGALKASSSGGSVQVAEVRGDVTVSSSGGAVEVRAVRGALDARSSGGSVTARVVEGPAVADSSGGAVTLETVSGEVTASSSGGGVTVRGAGGRVKVSSSGGPVEVVFAPANAQGGDISSSGGGVRVAVDPAVGLTVDAEASGGSVRADLPVTVRGVVSRGELHGVVNGGGPLLKLRSSGGGITLGAAVP